MEINLDVVMVIQDPPGAFCRSWDFFGVGKRIKDQGRCVRPSIHQMGSTARVVRPTMAPPNLHTVVEA